MRPHIIFQTAAMALLAVAFCLSADGLRAAETISLAGEWRFALDRNDAGTNENWFAKNLPDKIQLPGILQAQGYGDDISTNTPWVLALGDAWWKIQPASLREHFSQPGHVEVPFLSQPPKHYLGARGISAISKFPPAGAGGISRSSWSARIGKAQSGLTKRNFPRTTALSRRTSPTSAC